MYHHSALQVSISTRLPPAFSFYVRATRIVYSPKCRSKTRRRRERRPVEYAPLSLFLLLLPEDRASEGHQCTSSCDHITRLWPGKGSRPNTAWTHMTSVKEKSQALTTTSPSFQRNNPSLESQAVFCIMIRGKQTDLVTFDVPAPPFHNWRPVYMPQCHLTRSSTHRVALECTSVCTITLLIPSNPRDPYSELSIQRFLFRLRHLHAKCAFDLRRCPEPDRCPGHHADAEEGSCFGGQRSIGTNKDGVRRKLSRGIGY